MTYNGYIYETAFPRRLVPPLELKNNTVNDNDG